MRNDAAHHLVTTSDAPWAVPVRPHFLNRPVRGGVGRKRPARLPTPEPDGRATPKVTHPEARGGWSLSASHLGSLPNKSGTADRGIPEGAIATMRSGLEV
jgi:hypothetical protein